MKLSGKAVAIIVAVIVAIIVFFWLNNSVLSWG